MVLLGKTLIVLKMHRIVVSQAGLDLLNNNWVCFEFVAHIVTAVEFAGIVSELSAPDLLDFVEFGALFFDLFANNAHELVNACFIPLGVQDNHAFVFAIHLPFLLAGFFVNEY